MTKRLWASWILNLTESERQELSALEVDIDAIFDFVYSLTSTNINHVALNNVNIYMTNRYTIG